MTWYNITSFFRFLFTSTNQYGIHPPFTYKFLTKCLYSKCPKHYLKALKNNRKLVLTSSQVIDVKDFGSGSVQFSTKKRPVSQMAKIAGMSLHKSKLIFKIITYYNVKTSLELGTSVGLGSIAMSTQLPQNTVTSIEACPNLFQFSKKNIEKLQLHNVRLHNATFHDFLKTLSHQKKYDLIYLDGHHDKEATLAYFEILKKHIHKNSVVILDDIHWSEEMQEAWQLITKDESVKVSLDLYFWGILFFKPGLSKQYFKVRCFT